MSSHIQLPVDQSMLGYRRSAAYAKSQIISVSGRRITSQRHSSDNIRNDTSSEQLLRGDRKYSQTITDRDFAVDKKALTLRTCLEYTAMQKNTASPMKASLSSRTSTTEVVVTANNNDAVDAAENCDGQRHSACGSDVMLISNVTCHRSLDAFVRTETSDDRHSEGASSQCSKTRTPRTILLANENKSDWNPERLACVVQDE